MELTDVKCPFKTVSKSGKEYPCPQVCVRVAPGSKGEAYCRRHRKTFEFEIAPQTRKGLSNAS